MAKSSPALIEPTLLVWARTTAGYSVEGAAKKIGVTAEKLAACETGEDRITFSQLESASNVYKRPLAVFFLPAPPRAEQDVNDFRLDGETRATKLPPSVLISLRRARRLRDEALGLLRELGKQPKAFPLRAQIHEKSEAVAETMRAALSVPAAATGPRSNAAIAFKARKAAAERLGVLVFEISRVDCAEMRGAALPYDELPVAIVNGGEAPAGKSFTLLHELAHIFLRQNGVCDLAPTTDRSVPANIERYCNAVAAACLMPKPEISALVGTGKPREWSLGELAELSKNFQVSKEALLVRFVTLGYATRDYYFSLRNAFRGEHAEYRKSLKKEESTGGPSPAVLAVRNLGEPYVRLVLSAYEDDRIDLSTASDYLGVKVRHIPRIRALATASAAVT